MTSLARLPEPRMDGVEFGFLRFAAGERISFAASARSWFFHVRRGSVWVRLENEPAILVTAGSCIGIDGRRSFEFAEVSLRAGGSRKFERLETGASGADCPLEVLAGHAPLASNLLLASFWATVHVPHDHPGPAARWITQLADLIVLELLSDQERIERAGILQRLAEIVVIVLVRHMTEETEQLRTALPTALHDSRIWRALAAFHRAPAAPWTVEGLARVAGMSRTALAVRFQELLGVPPLQCLTSLRMDMAADMLAREDSRVKAIAERVGYSTEAAFNRAFVRQFGLSPGRWRTRHRTGSDEAEGDTP